jgi:GNAT superfamily N-acetyltransferase
LGAYSNDELVGYAIVFHNSGSIPQIAVAEPRRRRGFGRALLNAVQTRAQKSLTVNNVDAQAAKVSELFIRIEENATRVPRTRKTACEANKLSNLLSLLGLILEASRKFGLAVLCYDEI